MLHILSKVKIVIMSIIDSIRICVANSIEPDIILIHFINKHIYIFNQIILFYTYYFNVYKKN
jgi:hypothetical protein